MYYLLEQSNEKEKEKEKEKAKVKNKKKSKTQDNSQTTTKPQDQPTDDGIPKPAKSGDIKIQLIYTKTNLPIQNQNFVSAIQKALNKGNDYSSNNIFK